MGLLQEQSIPVLFQGVSRQPDSIRFPGQVEDALNVVFSVETGGFSKRNGTKVLKKIGLSTQDDYRLHVVNRSATEKYAMVHFGPGGAGGSLRVFDLADSTEKTVAFADPADATFFDKDPGRLAFLTVVDYTFVLDRELVVDMSAAPAGSGKTHSASQLTEANKDGTYKVTVKYDDGAGYAGSFTASKVEADNSSEPDQVVTALKGTLTTNKPDASWTIESDGSYLFIKNTNAVPFTVETSDPLGDTAFKTTVARKDKTDNLTARAYRDHLVEIRKATETEGYWLKFVPDDPTAAFGVGTWDETVPPGTQVDFDPATMPRALVRLGDGSFELQRLSWDTKKAGGEVLVPKPEFVGRAISDIVFRGNRLGFLSGETAYFSAAGDYFRFWPESATQSVATDPFGLTNSTNSVSTFTYGVSFRRSLFIMSDEAQFEAYGDVFTADHARIEAATQYPAKSNVRPVVLGDELYFVSEAGKNVVLHSYVYNENSTSEVANDVSKHARGYIVGPVRELEAGTLNGEVFVLSDNDLSKVYVHKFYYEGNERVQSAWGQYGFAGATVYSMGYVNGELLLLIKRDDGYLYLETLSSVEVADANFDIQPRLDRQEFVQGVYDGGTNVTTWTMSYASVGDLVALTTNQFSDPNKFLSLPVSVAGDTLTITGDYSEAPILVGENYDAYADLSKQYLRQGQEAIVNGRLQLRQMTLRYANSGYFTVKVLPAYRDEKLHTFTGRILGSGSNQIQKFSISSGRFRFLVGSGAENVNIRIGSDQFLPFTITSGAWIGFFNEISRQDGV